jgi:L-ascorbate metabolism protein UlaG (beta-lactamase superfamily)
MSIAHEISLPSGGTSPDVTTRSVFFIGNATVLIRYAGFTILTDPTFIHMHEQTWLGYGLHTTRLTNPAIDIGALPPLDFILLSHSHGDHFDQVAERDLDKALPIVTTPEAAEELGERGFEKTYSLDTWSSATVAKGNAQLWITATPGRHGPPPLGSGSTRRHGEHPGVSVASRDDSLPDVHYRGHPRHR